MEYKTVEGYQSERPFEIDEISSKTTVYLRRNIEEVPNIDTDGNPSEGTHWRYEEAQLTKEEYKIYSGLMEESKKIQDDLQSRIDYLSIMTDVDM